MRIGVPTEIKDMEGRVALTPAGVRELTARGHRVVIRRGAGTRSRIDDQAYSRQGARVVSDAEAVFAEADLILKVKEPQPEEVGRLAPGHVLFAYLHLAADPELARRLAATGATFLAYETVEDAHGRLPSRMSEIAGRLATQVAAVRLMAPARGSGRLMGGAVGVECATVVVIGGGAAGTYAARVAVGMGARVVVLDVSPRRLRELEAELAQVDTRFSSTLAVEELAAQADVIIGTILSPGARAPRVLTRKHLADMRPGVVVDVSIDQGGCFETSSPTTHSAPTHIVDDVIHYRVTNMPGAVPHTSTYALTNATLPYVLSIADQGVREALERDPGLAKGLNIADRTIVHPVVAREVDGRLWVKA